MYAYYALPMQYDEHASLPITLNVRSRMRKDLRRGNRRSENRSNVGPKKRCKIATKYETNKSL